MGRFGVVNKNWAETTRGLGVIVPEITKEEFNNLDIRLRNNLLFFDKDSGQMLTTNKSGEAQSANNSQNTTYVYSAADFGTDIVDFRIQLKPNHCYIVCGDILLDGLGLQMTGTTAILGLTSEVSKISGTGDSVNGALIKSIYTLTLQNISLTCDFQLLDIDTANLGAFDWTAVNIINTNNVGTIKNVSNFISFSCTFIQSAGLVFSGTFGTISFDTTLFDSAPVPLSPPTKPIITIASTAIIQRRLRFVFSAFVCLANEIGIRIETGASIPNDQFILFACNFSGGSSAYIDNITQNNNISDWQNNKGILNSASIGGLYMVDNTTATSVPNITTFVKILGTTLPISIMQRFSHTNNRLTYTGAIQNVFKISVVLSVTSASNTQTLVFRIYKSNAGGGGALLFESESQTTTSNSGRSENVKLQGIVNLASGDYIEVHAKNQTTATNIICSELNIIAERII